MAYLADVTARIANEHLIAQSRAAIAEAAAYEITHPRDDEMMELARIACRARGCGTSRIHMKPMHRRVYDFITDACVDAEYARMASVDGHAVQADKSRIGRIELELATSAEWLTFQSPYVQDSLDYRFAIGHLVQYASHLRMHQTVLPQFASSLWTLLTESQKERTVAQRNACTYDRRRPGACGAVAWLEPIMIMLLVHTLPPSDDGTLRLDRRDDLGYGAQTSASERTRVLRYVIETMSDDVRQRAWLPLQCISHALRTLPPSHQWKNELEEYNRSFDARLQVAAACIPTGVRRSRTTCVYTMADGTIRESRELQLRIEPECAIANELDQYATHRMLLLAQTAESETIYLSLLRVERAQAYSGSIDETSLFVEWSNVGMDEDDLAAVDNRSWQRVSGLPQCSLLANLVRNAAGCLVPFATSPVMTERQLTPAVLISTSMLLLNMMHFASRETADRLAARNAIEVDNDTGDDDTGVDDDSKAAVALRYGAAANILPTDFNVLDATMLDFLLLMANKADNGNRDALPMLSMPLQQDRFEGDGRRDDDIDEEYLDLDEDEDDHRTVQQIEASRKKRQKEFQKKKMQWSVAETRRMGIYCTPAGIERIGDGTGGDDVMDAGDEPAWREHMLMASRSTHAYAMMRSFYASAANHEHDPQQFPYETQIAPLVDLVRVDKNKSHNRISKVRHDAMVHGDNLFTNVQAKIDAQLEAETKREVTTAKAAARQIEKTKQAMVALLQLLLTSSFMPMGQFGLFTRHDWLRTTMPVGYVSMRRPVRAIPLVAGVAGVANINVVVDVPEPATWLFPLPGDAPDEPGTRDIIRAIETLLAPYAVREWMVRSSALPSSMRATLEHEIAQLPPNYTDADIDLLGASIANRFPIMCEPVIRSPCIPSPKTLSMRISARIRSLLADARDLPGVQGDALDASNRIRVLDQIRTRQQLIDLMRTQSDDARVHPLRPESNRSDRRAERCARDLRKVARKWSALELASITCQTASDLLYSRACAANQDDANDDNGASFASDDDDDDDDDDEDDDDDDDDDDVEEDEEDDVDMAQ